MGRILKTSSSVFTLLSLAISLGAHASDDGRCLRAFQNAESKSEPQDARTKRNDSSNGKIWAGVLGLGAGLGAVSRSPVVVGIYGTFAAVGAGMAYFSGQQADGLSTQAAQDAADAALIARVYRDIDASGNADTYAGKLFTQKLAIDPHDEPKVLSYMKEAMEKGDLCEGTSPKSLGAVVAELRKYDQEKVRGIF